MGTTLEELVEIEDIRKLRVMWSHYYGQRRRGKPRPICLPRTACAKFSEKYGGHWVGRDQIRDNYYKYAPPETPSYSGFHAATNVWINVLSATEAVGRWYILDFNFKGRRH